MNLPKNRQVIGTTEVINIPDIGMLNIPAKIDTGAYHSSIWASDIVEKNDKLMFVLFDKDSPYFTGQKVTVNSFCKQKIRSSFGHNEERYRISLKIIVGDNTYETDFTLANRSVNKYPVLLGRSLLKNRFVVDVTKRNVHFRLAKAKLVGEI